MPATLVAVTGMSPAILTETVWALACESPPTVPDEVLAVTTCLGREALESALLEARADWGGRSVWECLRAEAFRLAGLPPDHGGLQLSLRVVELPDLASGIRKPAEDIRTRAQHEETADFLIQALAPLCDAADRHVVASIAGGRKSMGALLYGAMSLVGKESDRVAHVLVSEPYEECRDFFYPAQPLQALRPRQAAPGDPPVLAAGAAVELADLPFVALRNRLAELNEPRLSFAGLVERYARAGKVGGAPPRLALDEETGVLAVEGRPLALAGRELVLAAFLMRRAHEGLPHFPDRQAAAAALGGFLEDWRVSRPGHRAIARLSGRLDEEDVSKALAGLRKKLRETGLESAIPHLAPERGRIGFETKGD